MARWFKSVGAASRYKSIYAGASLWCRASSANDGKWIRAWNANLETEDH